MNLAEIRKLPSREKFQILEALWEDMREEAEDADISDSHKKLLDERRVRIESGEEKLLDWDDVKNSYGQR